MAIWDDIWGAVRHTHDGITESVGAIAHDTRSKVQALADRIPNPFPSFPSVPSVDDIKNALPTVDGIADAVKAKLEAALLEAIGAMSNTFADSVKAILDHAVSKLQEVFGAHQVELTPIPPNAVMQQIAEALAKAESELNKQSLVIADGTVETELLIKAPGADTPGARTKIVFRVAPKP